MSKFQMSIKKKKEQSMASQKPSQQIKTSFALKTKTAQPSIVNSITPFQKGRAIQNNYNNKKINLLKLK